MTEPKSVNRKIARAIILVVLVLVAFGYFIGRDLARNDAASSTTAQRP